MKATKLSRLAVGVLLVGAAAPTVARADVVTFTFEGLTLQSGLTTLVLSGGGLTATLSRPGGAFAISDQSPFAAGGFPASWGSRTLDPFANPGSTAFFLNFSQGITGLSIQMGDFGQDDDVLTLQLFSGLDGTGTLLGTSTLPLPSGGTSNFSFLTPSVSTATPALSARFIGGSGALANSVYYDNITATFGATAVPEPGTLALLASGLIGVGFLRRRKRN